MSACLTLKILIDCKASNSLVVSTDDVETSDVSVLEVSFWADKEEITDDEDEDEDDGWPDDLTKRLLLLFKREFNRFMWAELSVDFLIKCVFSLGCMFKSLVWLNWSSIDLILLLILLSLFDLVINDFNELMSIDVEIILDEGDALVWLTLICINISLFIFLLIF